MTRAQAQPRRDTRPYPSPGESEDRALHQVIADPALPAPVDGLLPQFDLGAEKVTLGMCMTSLAWLDAALETLRADDFFAPAHQLIFAAILALVLAGKAPDHTSVRSYLLDHGTLREVGGPDYIASLVLTRPMHGNAATTANIIAEKARIRRTQTAAHRIFAEGYGCIENAQDYAERASTAMTDIAMERSAQRPENMTVLADRVMDAIKSEIAGEDDANVPRVSTGMPTLDRVLGPMKPSLIVVGAWAGVGKSSLMREWAFRIAARKVRRRGVVIFSLEMTREEMTEALAYRIAGVDGAKIAAKHKLTTDEAKALGEAFGWLRAQPHIWIDDLHTLPGTAPRQLEARVRQIQRTEAVKLDVEVASVFLDYLQLADGREGVEKGANREREIANIAYGVQKASQRTVVPWIAGSQLNEDGKKRKDGKPCAEDARESKAIVQAAHKVVLIHNPHYLERRRKMQEERGEYVAPDSEEVELIVDKNRGGGRTGIVPAKFLPWCTAFQDMGDA